MKELIYKYRLIIAIVITLIIVAVGINILGSFSALKVLPTESADSILAINKSNMYILNNKKIVKLPESGDSKDFQIIDSDITFTSTSPDKNKIYYVKGDTEASKSFIFDISTNNIKEYKLYDEFYWNKNEGNFVSIEAGKTSLFNESLSETYNNLSYSSFTSYAGIILGSTVTETPETQGYQWNVVNQDSTNVQNVIVDNYLEETSPWVIPDYMLYINGNEQFSFINKDGQKKNINELIEKARITNLVGDNQYYIVQEKDNLIIKSINLSTAQTSQLKKVNAKAIANTNNLSLADIKEVYYYGGKLYILIGSKILGINI